MLQQGLAQEEANAKFSALLAEIETSRRHILEESNRLLASPASSRLQAQVLQLKSEGRAHMVEAHEYLDVKNSADILPALKDAYASSVAKMNKLIFQVEPKLLSAQPAGPAPPPHQENLLLEEHKVPRPPKAGPAEQQQLLVAKQEKDAELRSLQKRADDIHAIEKDVNQVVELQKDLSTLVAEQQPMLDEAEHHILSAQEQAEEGVDQLKRAAKYKGVYRTIGIVAGGALGAAVGGPLGAVVGAKVGIVAGLALGGAAGAYAGRKAGQEIERKQLGLEEQQAAVQEWKQQQLKEQQEQKEQKDKDAKDWRPRQSDPSRRH